MLRYIIGISLISIGVIIIRALASGKILKKYQYAIWLIIPICMILLPFIKINIPAMSGTADTKISSEEVPADVTRRDIPDYVMVDGEKMDPQKIGDQYMYHDMLNDLDLVADREHMREIKASGTTTSAEAAGTVAPAEDDTPSGFTWLKYAYISVTALLLIALAAYNIGFISYCRRKRKFVGRDPESGLKIYSIRHKGAPFLLFNSIYVDKSSEKISKFTICHEACHHKHGDHIWVSVRYLVLILNWYNPVIWAAFLLSGRDCELACDEEVLKVCGRHASAGYVETLLGLLKRNSKAGYGFTVSTGMSGGYKMMKKRILNIKKPAKNSRKALALSMAAVLMISGCSMIDPAVTEIGIASLTTAKESEPIVSETEETSVTTSNTVSDTTSEATSEATENTTPSTEEEDVEEIVNTFPQSYKKKIGNCTFDISKLDCPEEVVFHKTQAKMLDAKYRQFVMDTLNGRPYKENKETEEIYCFDENDKWLYCFSSVDSSISFIKYTVPYLDSVTLDFESDNYNLDLYTKPKTFAFGTAEESFNKAADIFGKYGIDLRTGTTVDTYYLDHETLLKGTDMSDSWCKEVKVRNWTADDDAYMFVVKQSVQGITVSPMGSFLWPGSFHALSDVYTVIIYNKDGINVVEAWQEYCSYEQSKATEKLLSFDEIAQNVSDYLDYKSGSSKCTVTKAKLFATHGYSKDKNDGKPVELYWAVWVKENNKQYELRFNAITGEIAPRFVD